ncbi:MAG: lipoyl(octanoyl) transferase LipB [Rhodothermales bacterium]|nr:lipoyl(octanoyl) transferase LipB [Rhodothermales bacterium]
MADLRHYILGRQPYREIWELQKELQQLIISAKRSEPPVSLPHLVLQVEHPPVYTLGKSGQDANLLIDEAELKTIGATFERIDRGGDITFHGPGQLVLYPILDLDRIYNDLVRYLRTLEEAVIRTLSEFNIIGRRIPGRTGVWIGPDQSGGERKICAMGIRCSRWVTMHGLALNISNDLSYFDNIVPCGIDDADVTSIEKEVGRTVSADYVGQRLVAHLCDELELEHTQEPYRTSEEMISELEMAGSARGA